ncbi:MAG: hypothetical protein EO766_13235 [Hydrotalea sp. AMD]|uniref:hypothetical protein n=1 Tax=Hydrotalea sp. AMD TaxID=2501297 RepID=UPI0010253B4A|nr:hypothetical protein [Hydrotalea sp. AMD]RWZ86764.1 MAG: hypothetical protein EO766_13235 [Hydrotalea sp. AMD]
MILDLIKLGADIHRVNVEKGFWEDGASRNKGEMVMLIVSELGEAVEAHRKSRFVNYRSGEFAYVSRTAITEEGKFEPKLWAECFQSAIKDTLEDEIADTVIRILDYCQGFKIPLIEREYCKPSTGNFGQDVLRIVHYCICAYHEEESKDWGYILAAIQAFCSWYSINLLQHVNWKLTYNQFRPYKHGKSY